MGDSLNEDQRAYMTFINAQPLESRCWCGWYRHGRCPNPECRQNGKTRADYVRETEASNE